MSPKSIYSVIPEIMNGKAAEVDYTVYYPRIVKPENAAINTINNFSKYAAEQAAAAIENSVADIKEKNNVVRGFQLMFSSRFLISFKYEMNVFDEKKVQYRHISGAVWNVANGSSVHIKEFFRGNVRFKEMVLYILSGKIKEKIVCGENVRKDWHTCLYAAWQNTGYYICKEGFVFLLPKNTVKINEKGTTEILVSFSELKNQLGSRLLPFG